jgi:NAD(P)H-flavin reductase
VCSRLQGKEYCDCLWKGVCIYNEFIQNGKRVNNPRKDFAARVVSKKEYLSDLNVIVLDVGRGFALKAARPGSFVFIKAVGDEHYYDTPISVLKVDAESGYIYLLVKSISVKTKLIAKAGEKLIVRGVYRNGIEGLSKIIGKFGKIQEKEKILVLTKGVGFAPGVNLLEWIGQETQIDFVIDVDKVCKELVWDYIKPSINGKIEFVKFPELFENQGKGLKKLLQENKYDVVALLASDYYIEETKKLELGKTVLIHSNNAHICCGEGICGACSRVDEYGNVYKMCKCNLSQR